MRASSIRHPEKERICLIREWQIEFCDANTCAAAVLAFFEYWHNISLARQTKSILANDIAQKYQDPRSHDESLLQFHTLEEIIEGILRLFGRSKVIEAIQLLEEKSVITIHPNPNPKYAFDKTKYYLFHPHVCNTWLDEVYLNKNQEIQEHITVVQKYTLESTDLDDRASTFKPSTFRNGRSSFKNKRYIKDREITEEITEEITTKKEEENAFKNVTKINSLSASSLCNKDLSIGTALTPAQQEYVETKLAGMPLPLNIDVEKLKKEIIFELLDPSSFKKAEQYFINKLNIILSMLKKGQWTAPAKMYQSQKVEMTSQLTNLQEALRNEQASLSHWKKTKEFYPNKMDSRQMAIFDSLIKEHEENVAKLMIELNQISTGKEKEHD